MNKFKKLKHARICKTLMMLAPMFLWAWPMVLDAQSARNKWHHIKVKTSILKTKSFDAFIAIPKDADSLRALFAAVPNGNVWYSRDGYGKNWEETQGLKGVKVRTFLAHPGGEDAVLACTDQGLYQLIVGSLAWHEVGSGWKHGAMLYVTFADSMSEVIFATTANAIFKLTRGIDIWQPFPVSVRSKPFNSVITAIFFSPLNATQLIVGTEEGIFVPEIKNDSLVWQAKVAGAPPSLNSFALRRNRYAREEILALSKSQGAYYSLTGRAWWPINNNLEKIGKNYLPFHSLTVDQNSSTKSCFAATARGEIKQYKFSGLQVGLLKISSDNVATWELERIFARLYQQFSICEGLEFDMLDTLKIENKSMLDELLARKGTVLQNYDKVIWAKASNSVVSNYYMSIDIKVLNRKKDGSYQTSNPYAGEQEYDQYYPGMVDSLALEIIKKEFAGHGACKMKRSFFQDWRTYAWGGAVLAALASAVAALSDDEKHSLPAPPPFP